MIIKKRNGLNYKKTKFDIICYKIKRQKDILAIIFLFSAFLLSSVIDNMFI